MNEAQMLRMYDQDLLAQAAFQAMARPELAQGAFLSALDADHPALQDFSFSCDECCSCDHPVCECCGNICEFAEYALMCIFTPFEMCCCCP